ncbi:hypothetical protein MKEN_00791900 [Mycena kentingensis (nom. inval.)]|nr:hypothetical protein MKEN_00791900 [Mycena kentingensis (nom. inval.)]
MTTTNNLSDSCLFCGIPSHKIAETEHSLAFLDIFPVSEGHTQIIPKYHAETLGDLPDEYLQDIGPLIKKVALSTGVKDYNILQNNGKSAFQHVPHVHFHVVPKPNATEGLILTLDDNWPQRKATNEELAATAEKMKQKL